VCVLYKYSLPLTLRSIYGFIDLWIYIDRGRSPRSICIFRSI